MRRIRYNSGMEHSEHETYMNEALALAAKGSGQVSPNPMVGSVIVRDGEIIGRGYHMQCGGPHAEVNALANCRANGHDPAGATMYVTLEPCCHFGKTPPCTEAIIEAKIAKVVIATLDDFAQVNGKGVERLKSQGIEVEIGICQDEARTLNAGFFKVQQSGKPYTILKWAQSIDGKLAWPANSDRRWITNAASRKHVHELRSRCDAILVGIGTVLADDPMLDVRLDDVKRPQLRRIVLDSKLQIPLNSKLVTTAKAQPVLVYTLQNTIETEKEKVSQLQEAGVMLIPVEENNGTLNLEAVLNDIPKQGANTLMVEGGQAVLDSFFKMKLADEIYAYIAPVLIGENETLLPQISLLNACELDHVQTMAFDGDVLIRATLK